MLDKKTEKDLVEKYSDIAHRTDRKGRTLAVRPPEGHQQLAFLSKVARDQGKAVQYSVDYVRECAVYPEAEADRAAFINDNPLLVMELASALNKMATGDGEVVFAKN